MAVTEREDAVAPDAAARAAASGYIHHGRIVEGWYVVGRSRDLERGAARSTEDFGDRLVVYRGRDGLARCMDGTCAHLGADLGVGAVEGTTLRCPFHGWRFAGTGKCVDAPGHDAPPRRRLRTYPTIERYGLIFIYFGGQEPRWAVPEMPGVERYRVMHTPSQVIDAHPHLVTAHGLDASHVIHVHGIHLTRPPRLRRVDEHRITMALRGRLESPLKRVLTGTRRRQVTTEFTTIGPNMGWLDVHEPISFHGLFTNRPGPGGTCHTSTVLFLPKGARAAVQAVLILMSILHQDRGIIDAMRFHRSFSRHDEGWAEFASYVDTLPVVRRLPARFLPEHKLPAP